MSIMFNANQFGIVEVSDEETEERIALDQARGHIPTVVPRERLIRLKHSELEELYGSFIEINRDACTDEEYQKIRSGEVLRRTDYGGKWRMWEGGFPTPEQMASTPWEEISEGGVIL